MQRLNFMTAAKMANANHAQILRQITRQQIVWYIVSTITKIETLFCIQDGRLFRHPDEDYDIVLDADCVSAVDFIYQIEVTDPVTGMTAMENRTLGKITLDSEDTVCLYPRGDENFDAELMATEMDTDTLFRLCDYLESSYAIIVKDS